MPRFWFSGPRILGGLIRPGISFSGRELASWRKKAPKVLEDTTLGVYSGRAVAGQAMSTNERVGAPRRIVHRYR